MISLEAAATNPTYAERKIIDGIAWADARHLAVLLEVPIGQLAKFLKIAPGTMRRRRITGKFTTVESERVIRFARLWFFASQAVGGPRGARSWLKRPQHGLGGRIPLEVAGLEIGARAVENLLKRIDTGVVA